LLCREAGFFAQEGIDVEIVHAKINPKAIESSRPGGERYDEVGTVLRDMVAFGIDIIPDESERMRDLTPMVMMEGHFFPLDGQLTAEGVWRILEEHLDAGVFSKSITRADVENLIDQDLVQEAWAEISETDEIKRNLERLQPVIERVGY
jgi:hypothetical protein